MSKGGFLDTCFISIFSSRCPNPQALAQIKMSGSKLTPDDRELVTRAFQLLDEEDVGHISGASAASILERLGFNVQQDKRGKLAGQDWDLKQIIEVCSFNLRKQELPLYST